MKFLLSFLFLCTAACAQNNCELYTKRYVPRNLAEALVCLDCSWTDDRKIVFKALSEDNAVAEEHFREGLSIRNRWGLWKGKNALVKYFHSLGIFHPDDMSGIILHSFHRKLNGRDLNTDSLAGYYKDYWDRIKKREAENLKRFELLQIGDTVSIAFSKQRTGEDSYSLAYIPNNEPVNDSQYCICKATVVTKYMERSRPILTVRIFRAGNCANSTLGNFIIAPGKLLDYDMSYFYLKPG